MYPESLLYRKQNDTLIGVKEESDVYTERKNAASGFRFLKSEDASAARLRRRTLSCKVGQRLHDTVIVALACFALVSQWTAYAVEIPNDCIYLVASDSSKYHASLTTDATHSNWAGGVKKGEGNYYIPEGMTAQANGTAQTVIGTIYCAGRVTSRGSASEPVTFDDLRLLEGGDLYHSLVCQKRGNITVLSENPDKPSLLSYERTTQWSEWFNLAAAVTGSENSQLLYRMSAGGKGFLILNDGSDEWVQRHFAHRGWSWNPEREKCADRNVWFSAVRAWRYFESEEYRCILFVWWIEFCGGWRDHE